MYNYKRLSTLNVLYVEDEQDVMEEIEDILGIQVGRLFSATNGKEGLDIFNSEDIDIIISDIQMPVMDGFEMIEEIRKKDENIPVVITTAFNELEFLNKAIDLKVDKYITKPIDFEQFISVLDRASEVVFQRKQIEERDMLLKSVLDMQPYYSLLVDEDNIEKVNQDILKFLGYEKDDEIEYNFSNIELDCQVYSNLSDVTKIITDVKNENKNEVICLKPKDQELTKYILKPSFFEETKLFLIAFFEYDKVHSCEEFKSCLINTNCRTCSL